MKALILDNDIIQIEENEFPVNSSLIWVECPIDTTTDWKYEGGQILPPDLDASLTTEEIINDYEEKIDLYIEEVARDKGYGRVSVSPSIACLGYSSYANEYQTEAIAYGQWLSSIWPITSQIMDDVLAENRPVPTWDELKAELPIMIWP